MDSIRKRIERSSTLDEQTKGAHEGGEFVLRCFYENSGIMTSLTVTQSHFFLGLPFNVGSLVLGGKNDT